MAMGFSLSNIGSLLGFSIHHVSGNLCNMEKLEVVGEDITPAPSLSRSCLGTRTKVSAGRGADTGPGTCPQSRLVQLPPSILYLCCSPRPLLPPLWGWSREPSTTKICPWV